MTKYELLGRMYDNLYQVMRRNGRELQFKRDDFVRKFSANRDFTIKWNNYNTKGDDDYRPAVNVNTDSKTIAITDISIHYRKDIPWHKSKKVFVYSVDTGEHIGTYLSRKEASDVLGIEESYIYRIMNKKIKKTKYLYTYEGNKIPCVLSRSLKAYVNDEETNDSFIYTVMMYWYHNVTPESIEHLYVIDTAPKESYFPSRELTFRSNKEMYIVSVILTKYLTNTFGKEDKWLENEINNASASDKLFLMTIYNRFKEIRGG